MLPSSIPADQLNARKKIKYRSMKKIMGVAKRTVLLNEDGDDCPDFYSRVACEECGSGDDDHELILCDKCDRGYHMRCLRPIMARVPNGPWFCPACTTHHHFKFPINCFTQKKIEEIFRIQKCRESGGKLGSPQDAKKRRRHGSTLVLHKKRRRLLPYIPTEDPARQILQLRSLAAALTVHGMEFSNELTYVCGMADRSANQAIFEKGGMQVLPKEDIETLEHCKAMHNRGEYPPLVVTYDKFEGYTVQTDAQIKDMTLIGEYVGDVDYSRNREQDDCDSLMTLLLSTDPSKSLVICPEKRGNIGRFISGINNYTPEARKKLNIKCVRYSVGGECRVLLVAARDISKGERLYYDYNGYLHEYPTHNFV